MVGRGLTLQVENKIGLLLHCNIIVQELPDGKIEVAAIDPVQSMQVVGNPELKGIPTAKYTYWLRAEATVDRFCLSDVKLSLAEHL